MKYLCTFIVCFFLTSVYGQKCGCSHNPELKDIISCKKTQLENGAKIYWEYDCHSSWITFQHKNIKRKIFELEKELIALSGRLGYRSWKEYKNSFLVENSMVSGCCQPEEYILYNKNSGRKIAELGTLISINDDRNQPYIVTMKTDSQILYTNLNNNRSCSIQIPKNKIENTLRNSNELYPENLFENAGLNHGILSVTLKYKDSEKADWKTEIIKLNTKKCLSSLK